MNSTPWDAKSLLHQALQKKNHVSRSKQFCTAHTQRGAVYANFRKGSPSSTWRILRGPATITPACTDPPTLCLNGPRSTSLMSSGLALLLQTTATPTINHKEEEQELTALWNSNRNGPAARAPTAAAAAAAEKAAPVCIGCMQQRTGQGMRFCLESSLIRSRMRSVLSCRQLKVESPERKHRDALLHWAA